ncbi:MAG: alpha/beta hydrolase [Erysipelotrichaceae bacterium]|nr:alpha/beta hydrolase [Erysipelotrichaceae bacterium]
MLEYRQVLSMKLKSERRYINTPGTSMEIIILHPLNHKGKLPGILWIHGGGYVTGFAEMVYASCGRMLAKKYGAVVISPQYRLSGKAPYPAALEDCFSALQYMDQHKEELGIDRIIVGGESAGGGLAVATCLYARDNSDIEIAMQIPLYPMIDCQDTESSANNHRPIWNTRRNHMGWKKYLGKLYDNDNISPYASPARETDYRNLPPCYTFVCEGEPFYRETLRYVENLQKAGIMASVDVYKGNIHSFDLLTPWTSQARTARRILCDKYREIIYSDQQEEPND